MRIKIQKTIEEEVEISLPVYYRNILSIGKDTIGVVDENTVIKVYDGEGYVMISQGILFSQEIESWEQRLQKITEDEFFDAYQSAHEKLSITPKLIEK